MDATIEPIIRQWVTTGVLLNDSRPLLQEQYRIEIGAPVGCKPCASNWFDIKHHFWYQFKQLDRQAYLMRKDVRKYLIIGLGFLMLPGESTSIVNDGEDTEDTKVLTDEMAEAILVKYPSYSDLIQINPAWQDEQDAEAGESDESEDDQSDQIYKALQSRIDVLKQEKATLEAENGSLKEDLAKVKDEARVLKGQATRAKNELATLKGTPLSSEPVHDELTLGTSPEGTTAGATYADEGGHQEGGGKVDVSGVGGSSEGTDTTSATEATT